MKFKDYLKRTEESTATKRNVTGPYAKMMYPSSVGLTYRMQYSPDSIKWGKSESKKKRRKKKK